MRKALCYSVHIAVISFVLFALESRWMPNTKPKETPEQPPEEVPVPLPVLIADSQTPVPVVMVADTTPGAQAGPVLQATPTPATVGVPVNMTVVAPPTVQPNVVKGEGSTLAPTTTEQQDVVTEGQRRINLIWEITQSIIAICVTGAIIYLAIVQTPAETITNAFFLIIGFYYSRVNHESTGGVGQKPNEPPYTGR